MAPQILTAAITVQALHGMSNFETVQELRCNLRRKAPCGLSLHDIAFDPSLLAYFRRRLTRLVRPNRVFEPFARSSRPPECRRASTAGRWAPPFWTTRSPPRRPPPRLSPRSGKPREPTRSWAVQCTAHDQTDPGKLHGESVRHDGISVSN
ncbi:transposase [Streptomyces sp. NBC_00090]|uniref:transposase n=1 Tax=Streptomyces sp. NBC_00090 TaxID=2903619 RepID=UPI003247832F